MSKCEICGNDCKRGGRWCSGNCWNKGNKDKMKVIRKRFAEKHGTNYSWETTRVNGTYEGHKKKQHKKEMTKKREKWAARLTGYLKRKDSCTDCGSTLRLEFHHTDYINNKGRTLCMPCHRVLHTKRGDLYGGKET